MAGHSNWAVLPAILLLVGCAPNHLEVGSITEIKPVAGASGTDVYAGRRANGEQVPMFAGDQIVDVRSYSESEGSTPETEMAGATCKLTATGFSADLTTPAKVRVPIYRGQSSTISVACEKQGFANKLAQSEVFNATKHQRLNSGANGGLIGAVVAIAVNELSDESNDDFRYPMIRVVMSRKAPKTAAQSAAP